MNACALHVASAGRPAVPPSVTNRTVHELEPASSPHTGVVGVLGGMGPLATIDFMRKMLAQTPAQVDQQHVPVVVSSVPQIPDRLAAFRGIGPSPLQALIGSGRRLVEAGVSLIVMPCNTAHLWFDELQGALPVPMIHIVDAAITQVRRQCGARARIGLLATEATVESGIYAARSPEGIEWLLPTAQELRQWVTPAIAAVKAGELDRAKAPLAHVAAALARRGADAVVMGCTEIPIALSVSDVAVTLVDATDALAREAVRWSLGARLPQ